MTTRLTARWAFLPGGELGEDVAIDVAGGVIREVARRGRSTAAADRVIDLEDAVLLPGLVNAHVHLELSGFKAPAVPRSATSFPYWLARLALRRALTPRRKLAAAAELAVRQMLRGGVTCIGEVSTLGAAGPALRGGGLAGVWYREMVSPRPGGAEAAFGRAVSLAAREARLTGLRPGLFPHAPYSVSARLFGASARHARARAWPLAMHVSESAEETELFERGTGPFARLCRFMGGRPPASSGLTPTRWLDGTGALGPQTALVHMTQATPGDIELVASRGASVVVCPRSAEFLGGGPHHLPCALKAGTAPPDLRRFLDAGVYVGLGTDSPASGGTPSLLEEMRALARAQPGLSPREILLMATEGGARALGLAGRCGALAPGARADVAAIVTAEGSGGDPLSAWLEDGGRTSTVLLGGRRVADGSCVP